MAQLLHARRAGTVIHAVPAPEDLLRGHNLLGDPIERAA